MTQQLVWGSDAMRLTFEWDAGSSPRLAAAATTTTRLSSTHSVPFFEIITAGAGHRPASSRLSHTRIGLDLRYVSHTEWTDGEALFLDIVTRAEAIGLEAVAHLRSIAGISAVQSTVTVRNVSAHNQVLRSVASWSADIAGPASIAGWSLVRGTNDWLGEGRFTTTPLRDGVLPELRTDLTGHDPRGSVTGTSHGSWSTGTDLPVAALTSEAAAWAWQIEHNGAWRWEVGEEIDGGSFTLSGPTDDDHAWAKVLHPGEYFTTVPVGVALGKDFDSAVGALTLHRRANRRVHPDNTAMPVVFNDYMNTLNGDPTTEKLLPLVDAAARVGAEVFCIDAGWYDNSAIAGAWWSSVGEWQPSTVRFPGGLGEVIDRIRDRGMVAGLWLEPEVIGVNSPIAARLPEEAFLQRFGQRIEEHERFHLDFRHPAVTDYLDFVVDGLITDFGVGFFKFDYNINAGTGTDVAADTPGDGLLQHNRAHLAWLDRLLDRHPNLVIENCSSGAMRMDFAMLSRLQMQSTSDQQDFLRYPPIAAAAPLSMLPEQAANWAYPQPGMNDEEIAFCLVSGLLGRFYLSGYLNMMTDAQRALVEEAVTVAKQIRGDLVQSRAVWPLGLPQWTDPQVALGLHCGRATYVSVWNKTGAADIHLQLSEFTGIELDVRTIFPADLPEWPSQWDRSTGILTVQPTGTSPAARTFRLVPTASGETEISPHHRLVH
ncbi:alpha-galactosidase [Glaciihabitans tibetensis]|uniref:Alpha-galactosidase n=1 Tax=Glaciihabitans tibetensis TaxID=1266600 RepID=A0A2T0VH05_9MICO|nr:glycoside hydrolase family 36 protein [Glaciihabitans tibetensis]PRY69492.1 alpha-galactosidase [Glaciihabitans tibetensis]